WLPSAAPSALLSMAVQRRRCRWASPPVNRKYVNKFIAPEARQKDSQFDSAEGATEGSQGRSVSAASAEPLDRRENKKLKARRAAITGRLFRPFRAQGDF